MRPDTYQIRVKSSGHVELIKQDLAVRENSPNDVGALRLSAGGTVRGLVFDLPKYQIVQLKVPQDRFFRIADGGLDWFDARGGDT